MVCEPVLGVMMPAPPTETYQSYKSLVQVTCTGHSATYIYIME
eukprot:COSAG01_NODE_348_length_18498_cov_181.563128_8_plen_43_part_00